MGPTCGGAGARTRFGRVRGDERTRPNTCGDLFSCGSAMRRGWTRRRSPRRSRCSLRSPQHEAAR